MPSRRDQIQSYQFLVQRITAAFVGRDGDPAHSPTRRLGGAGLASIMFAVLALAGVGGFGLVVSGGNKTWRSGNFVIIEKESGTRYVYQNGRLYQMANYISALLVLQQAAPTISVSRNSLVDVARGPQLGIPGAPDGVPPRNRLLGKPWTICSQPGTDDAGQPVSRGILNVGHPATGGRSLGEDGLLATNSGTNTTVLVWHQHSHVISDRKVVFDALGLNQQPITPLAASWLNALPGGAPIASVGMPDRGKPSSANLPGALIGEIRVTIGSPNQQFYLVRTADLQQITKLQAAILLADPATRAAYPGSGASQVQPKPMTLQELANARKAPGAGTGDEQPPADSPRIARLGSPTSAVCASYSDPSGAPQITVDATVPAGSGVQTPKLTDNGVPLVDRVDVQPGWAAVVEAVQSPDAPSGTLYLVTDLGLKYALASQAVLAMLGYDKVTPLRLPVKLLSTIPNGPPLDPAAARRPVTGGG